MEPDVNKSSGFSRERWHIGKSVKSWGEEPLDTLYKQGKNHGDSNTKKSEGIYPLTRRHIPSLGCEIMPSVRETILSLRRPFHSVKNILRQLADKKCARVTCF